MAHHQDMNGDWFRQKLTEKQKSQRALARHLELDPAAITLMLRGERRMQMHEAKEIAVFLGEPLVDVLRAAGMNITQAQATDAPLPVKPGSTTAQQLEAKRDALLAERAKIDAQIEALSTTISLFK